MSQRAPLCWLHKSQKAFSLVGLGSGRTVDPSFLAFQMVVPSIKWLKGSQVAQHLLTIGSTFVERWLTQHLLVVG